MTPRTPRTIKSFGVIGDAAAAGCCPGVKRYVGPFVLRLSGALGVNSRVIASQIGLGGTAGVVTVAGSVGPSPPEVVPPVVPA